MLKIRRRERIDSSPPEGMRQEWTEYQVIDGRKILARCGTQSEAEQRIIDLDRVKEWESFKKSNPNWARELRLSA